MPHYKSRLKLWPHTDVRVLSAMWWRLTRTDNNERNVRVADCAVFRILDGLPLSLSLILSPQHVR